MDAEALEILNEFNRAVIKYRGIYSRWAKEHGASYCVMLVLYTIRDRGYCTQKQICEGYLVPKQTVNNAFARLRRRGVLREDARRVSGREKAFVLTDEGNAYAASFLKSLDDVEGAALERTGRAELRALTESLLEYARELNLALEKTR